jgi:hypothetical protein
MSPKTLPRHTYLLHVFGDPDKRGRSSFAAWWREPFQGGVIAARLLVTNLDTFVADCLARGWRVRIIGSKKPRDLEPKKSSCHRQTRRGSS